MQLDFLAQLDPPKARRRDPATSHQAALKAREFQTTHANRIVAALRKHGPMTVDEIGVLVSLNGHQVGKRMKELTKAQLVRPTGHERPSQAGVPQRVWEAA